MRRIEEKIIDEAGSRPNIASGVVRSREADLVQRGVCTSARRCDRPAPPPAAELQKLDFMAGHWTRRERATMGPPGTASTKWSETTDAEWMDGKYFLVMHSDMDLAPMGKGNEMAVFGYDSDNKVYTYNAFNSMG